LICCRVQTSACLTPCGGLVLAASEDNTVHVWNADTGQQLAIYSGLQFYQGTSGVDYHPFEHMVAFASYGADAFIVVCDYDKLSSGKDIGLQMLVPQDATLEAAVGTELYMKSSTPLHCGISSLKEKKKNVSVNDSEMEVFNGSSLLAADTNESSLSPNSMNFASPVIQYDSGTSKARLTSIIEKIDHVLSKTHSKSSQKVSEIVGRSLIQKLNDSSPSKIGNLGQALNQKKKSESVFSVK
jgi:WD40 repeat protein